MCTLRWHDLAHQLIKIGLRLKSDTWNVGHPYITVMDGDVVRKTVERLEQSRIRFVSAQPESGCYVERHLVSTMGDATACRPAVLFHHTQDAHILYQPVAQGTVELQDVAIRPHPTIPNQVPGVLQREEVSSRRQRTIVSSSQLCLQFVV